MSAGSAIQEAARAAAERRGGGGGQEGDFGLGTGAHGRQLGALEILSDTQGVDFGPYLQRILQDVKENWYRIIPESAQMKKGKLAIEFAITKDGQVAGMKLVATSGDTALDRAAWAELPHRIHFRRCPPILAALIWLSASASTTTQTKANWNSFVTSLNRQVEPTTNS